MPTIRIRRTREIQRDITKLQSELSAFEKNKADFSPQARREWLAKHKTKAAALQRELQTNTRARARIDAMETRLHERETYIRR